MKTVKDFKYTPRADMAVDIRDFLEIVAYLQTLENKIIDLEQRLNGKVFMHKLEAMKEGND